MSCHAVLLRREGLALTVVTCDSHVISTVSRMPTLCSLGLRHPHSTATRIFQFYSAIIAQGPADARASQ